MGHKYYIVSESYLLAYEWEKPPSKGKQDREGKTAWRTLNDDYGFQSVPYCSIHFSSRVCNQHFKSLSCLLLLDTLNPTLAPPQHCREKSCWPPGKSDRRTPCVPPEVVSFTSVEEYRRMKSMMRGNWATVSTERLDSSRFQMGDWTSRMPNNLPVKEAWL